MKVEIVLFIYIAVSLIGGVSFMLTPTGAPKTSYHIDRVENRETSHTQKEALRLWEEAVSAKGGRERLHNIHNVVISARGSYASRRLKKSEIQQEALYVLPNKLWSWSDYRPDVFGLRIEMYNFDRGAKYVISDGEPNRQLESLDEVDRKNIHILKSLLPYLPETKWLRPVLVGVTTGKVGSQSVDIVETTVRGARVDFALDKKTHLPPRVSYYSTDKNKTYVTAIDLADYVEVDGIKVPKIVKYEDGTQDRKSYQFNVVYNEEIFVKPPPIEAGPEAWKRRR